MLSGASQGIVFGGSATRLEKCFRNFFTDKKVELLERQKAIIDADKRVNISLYFSICNLDSSQPLDLKMHFIYEYLTTATKMLDDHNIIQCVRKNILSKLVYIEKTCIFYKTLYHKTWNLLCLYCTRIWKAYKSLRYRKLKILFWKGETGGKCTK